MRRFGKKVSFRLSDQQLSDLKRIEKHLGFVTRSALLKESLRLLAIKYPDQEKAKTEVPLFPDKELKKPTVKTTKKIKKKVGQKRK